MRSLTVDEIEALERQGCSAEDWTRIGVAEDFCPAYIHNVAFYGDVSLGLFDKQVEVDEGFARHSGIRNAVLRDVSIGDNCLIENVGCHICRYSIGDECYISGVGLITCTEGASFGQGNVVSVLNEAGPGNVVIYDGLTSQMAAFMVHCSGDKALWEQLQAMVATFVGRRTEGRGTIGYGVKIVNTREIVNSCIGDECEISGAERLCDCTLSGTPDASIYIGSGVECDNTVVQAGASVVGGARLSSCFVGEACHVGRGFSAESSLFFANSYVDNGEACAAFCGPFTVSHHKATLLIGCACSFFNAGSATNFSNHAYKLGPLHTGTLARGSKTGSGAHLLLPARIGAFSVCMGKIETHPDTRQLPFSYVIGSAGATYLVPGRIFEVLTTIVAEVEFSQIASVISIGNTSGQPLITFRQCIVIVIVRIVQIVFALKIYQHCSDIMFITEHALIVQCSLQVHQTVASSGSRCLKSGTSLTDRVIIIKIASVFLLLRIL